MIATPTDSRHGIRRARHQDAASIATLFACAYEASSHPCKSADFVATTLHGRADVWYVSELGDRITGCMGMLPHRWNRVWEVGRAVTHPDFRGGGIATELAQRALDDAWWAGECDLVVGFPRSRTMYRLAQVLTPPFRAVGHDGGINVAGGRREYHLVAVSFAVRKRFDRIRPASESRPGMAFVRDTVLTPFGLSGSPGSYPPLLISGDCPRHPDDGPFTFNYDPYCPSDSLEITAYAGPKHDHAGIAADLLTMLESFGNVRHARLAVLADKVEFQRMLQFAGFGITAYLPAWHLQNGARYDCVLMTRRTTDDEPVDHGNRDLIDSFNLGYDECLSCQMV